MIYTFKHKVLPTERQLSKQVSRAEFLVARVQALEKVAPKAGVLRRNGDVEGEKQVEVLLIKRRYGV